MISHNSQPGFTAVELLITLFVAAIFLASGYQLYISTIKDSGDIRAQSIANNTAYEYLQKYKAEATSPCTPSTPLQDDTKTIANLTAVKVTVDVTCPKPATPTLSKITVTVKYNNPQKVVKNATYVTK